VGWDPLARASLLRTQGKTKTAARSTTVAGVGRRSLLANVRNSSSKKEYTQATCFRLRLCFEHTKYRVEETGDQSRSSTFTRILARGNTGMKNAMTHFVVMNEPSGSKSRFP